MCSLTSTVEEVQLRNVWKIAFEICYTKHLYRQEKKIKLLFSSFFFNTVAILHEVPSQ